MSKTIDLGRVVGNSAYEDAVEKGYVGTLEQWLASLKGEKGEQGIQGIQGIQGERGLQGEQGVAGQDGNDGVDGYSPTVAVSKSGKTTTITITDKNGDHTATIQDGTDGQDGNDGANGTNGVDGYSPTVSLSKSGKTTTLVITDKNGEHTATIVDGNDGQNGADGRDGTNGTNGTNGQDGVSPAVSVSAITGGHQVTFTDATHPQGQSFNVMDGQDAQTGPAVSLTFTYEDDTTQTYSFLTAPSNS